MDKRVFELGWIKFPRANAQSLVESLVFNKFNQKKKSIVQFHLFITFINGSQDCWTWFCSQLNEPGGSKLRDPTVSYFPPVLNIEPLVLLLLPSELTALLQKESPRVLGLDDGGGFLRDLVRLRFHGESNDSCNHCSLFFGHLTPVRDALVLNKRNFHDFFSPKRVG